jgi:hypothetical protein
MKIKLNVGGLDAILRLGIGSGFIYIGFINLEILNDQIASIILGIFGVIIFLSGAFRYCPLYIVIGFNSRNTDHS